MNIGNDGSRTDDDFVPIDYVPVVFRARALNATMNIPEDGAYSWFIITGYDLIWTSAERPGELTDYNITGGLAERPWCPIDDEAVVSGPGRGPGR